MFLAFDSRALAFLCHSGFIIHHNVILTQIEIYFLSCSHDFHISRAFSQWGSKFPQQNLPNESGSEKRFYSESETQIITTWLTKPFSELAAFHSVHFPAVSPYCSLEYLFEWTFIRFWTIYHIHKCDCNLILNSRSVFFPFCFRWKHFLSQFK